MKKDPFLLHPGHNAQREASDGYVGMLKDVGEGKRFQKQNPRHVDLYKELIEIVEAHPNEGGIPIGSEFRSGVGNPWQAVLAACDAIARQPDRVRRIIETAPYESHPDTIAEREARGERFTK